VFDLPKYGDGVCLARMAELLEILAIDREKLSRRSVVVTGSNGKGSTAAFCASVGRTSGLRTGLFTSPHLFRVNERFQIDGVPIADPDLIHLKSRIETAVGEISRQRRERFGSFEAMFALACLYFQESGCDFAVFEAGIGGRYDPVRLVGAHVACVTSVDTEHVELLGNSLELIAFDKSDACAAGGTIVYGENCRNLKPQLLEYNRYREIDALFVHDKIGIGGEAATPSRQQFDFTFEGFEFRSLETRLLGSFQFNNAAIATALFLLWLRREQRKQTPAEIEAAVRDGLRDTRWPGRLEVIRPHPLTIVDVGHTPDGIKQSLASLQNIYGREGWLLVIGLSADKKANEIVGALAPSFNTIICTAAHHKGMAATSIASAAHEANPSAAVEIAATIEDAVGLSQAVAAAQSRKIYVAGGLFLAIEYAVVARGGHTKDLSFF
jgi:dihydrofolate synthase/folylpolyglutamate synthase